MQSLLHIITIARNVCIIASTLSELRAHVNADRVMLRIYRYLTGANISSKLGNLVLEAIQQVGSRTNAQKNGK